MFSFMRFSSLSARRSRPALLLGMILLVGCSSTPTTTHQYTLPQHPVVTPEMTITMVRPGILVTPVQLAGHLQVNGIVFQTSPIEVNEARNNLWADTLSNQLNRSLYQTLSNRVRTVRLISDNSSDQPAYYVTVQLNQFQGRYDGKAIVSGQYLILNAERRLIRQHSFLYAEPLAQDGYTALVDALDKGIQHLADSITEQLEILPHS